MTGESLRASYMNALPTYIFLINTNYAPNFYKIDRTRTT